MRSRRGQAQGAGHRLGIVGNLQQCLSTRQWDPTWCSNTPECIGKTQSNASDSAYLAYISEAQHVTCIGDRTVPGKSYEP
jgi:hypothetical protein